MKFELMFPQRKTLNSLLAIILFSICAAVTGCVGLSAKSENKQNNKNENAKTDAEDSKDYRAPKRIATIDDDAVKESSGLAASRRNAEIFWTHNDSGDGAYLYAFDRAGRKRGVFQIPNAKNIDWEDMAAFTAPRDGKPYLFVGDIGDNEKKRADITVYLIPEPTVEMIDTQTSKKNPRQTETATAIRLKYPNGAKHDAETLAVSPAGDLYIVTKDFAGAAFVFKLSPPFDAAKTIELKKVGEISLPTFPKGFLTGGSIAPDGSRAVLCDYGSAWEFVLPTAAQNFDDIWKTAPRRVELGERQQGEAVTYDADGKNIYATSEKRPAPLIEIIRK